MPCVRVNLEPGQCPENDEPVLEAGSLQGSGAPVLVVVPRQSMLPVLSELHAGRRTPVLESHSIELVDWAMWWDAEAAA